VEIGGDRPLSSETGRSRKKTNQMTHKANPNCWEFKNCGREPNGVNVHVLGVCPAATNAACHGIHGGKRAGRTCWIIPNTMCDGEKQDSFLEKFAQCRKCDFYQLVKRQEGYEVAASFA
jgi:hypothetical protein